jgi:hypothetical protein
LAAEIKRGELRKKRLRRSLKRRGEKLQIEELLDVFSGFIFSGSIFMDGDIYSFSKVKILAKITSGFIGNLFRFPVAALVCQLRCPGDAVPADSEICFAAEAFFSATGKAFQIQWPSAIIAMKVGFGRVGKEIHGVYRGNVIVGWVRLRGESLR